MKKAVALTALLVALTAGACRSTAAHQKVVDNTDWAYTSLVWDTTKDAFLDLVDIGYVNFGVGDGLLLEAQGTKIFHLGFGWADTARCGMRPRALGAWNQRQYEYGLSIFYWRDITRQAVWGTETLFDQTMSYKGFDMDHQRETGHWLDFALNAHILIVGFESDVSPKEMIDFVGSLGRWVFTVIPVRSIFHELGIDGPSRDLGGDDPDLELQQRLGDPAGAVYQGETPFLERQFDPLNRKPLAPMAPKQN